MSKQVKQSQWVKMPGCTRYGLPSRVASPEVQSARWATARQSAPGVVSHFCCKSTASSCLGRWMESHCRHSNCFMHRLAEKATQCFVPPVQMHRGRRKCIYGTPRFCFPYTLLEMYKRPGSVQMEQPAKSQLQGTFFSHLHLKGDTLLIVIKPKVVNWPPGAKADPYTTHFLRRIRIHLFKWKVQRETLGVWGGGFALKYQSVSTLISEIPITDPWLPPPTSLALYTHGPPSWPRLSFGFIKPPLKACLGFAIVFRF